MSVARGDWVSDIYSMHLLPPFERLGLAPSQLSSDSKCSFSMLSVGGETNPRVSALKSRRGVEGESREGGTRGHVQTHVQLE